MIHNLRTKVLPDYFVLLPTTVTLLVPVSVSDCSIVKRVSEFQSFDIAESLEAFKSSDFSISNLDSVGALSRLKTTYMCSMHDMNIADKFDNYTIPVQDVQKTT